MPRRATRGAVAVLAALLLATPPAAAVDGPPGPAVETLLPGGDGDGGPAADALVHAERMFRTPDGGLVFGDVRGPRRLDPGTATVGPAGLPPLPDAARDGGLATDFWLAGAASYHLLHDVGERWLVRVDGEGNAEEVWRGSAEPGSPRPLTVRQDGAVVLGGPAVPATYLLAPGADTPLQIAPLESRLAAAADDGTVFVVATSGDPYDTRRRIVRIPPGGGAEVVAGPGPDVDATTVTPAAGQPATLVRLHPTALAVTPDGSRVAYAEVDPQQNSRVVRSFPLGGDVTVVAGSEQQAGTVCPVAVDHLLADAAAVLVACGGIRSYPYDGSAAPRAGAVVAGLNDAPTRWADSPAGTPLARAFLGQVRDVAVGPATDAPALATVWGVHAIRDGRLERLLDSGHVGPGPEWAGGGYADPYLHLDATYTADGTLLLLAPDPASPDGARWRITRPGAAGSAQVVAAGGGAEPADGADVADVALELGRIAGAAGTGFWLSQGRDVWRVDGAGTMQHAARAGSTVTWLGTDAAGGLLVASGDRLYRLGEGGLAAVSGLAGDSYVRSADGSVYAARTATVWRHRPDGSYVLAAGAGPGGTDVGPSVPDPVIAGLPDGRLVVAAHGPASAAVRVLQPAQPPAWAGASPTLQVTARQAGTGGRVDITVTVPQSAQPWSVDLRVGSDPAALSPTGGAAVPIVIAAGATSTVHVDHLDESDPAPLLGDPNLTPGQCLHVALFAWPGDGASGPPAAVASAVVPPRGTRAVAAGPAQLTAGTSATVTGRLTRDPGLTPVAGRRMTLEKRPAGAAAWTAVAARTTDATGRVRVDGLRPDRTSAYRWRHAGSAAWAAAVSDPVTITVRPLLTATAPEHVRLGSTLTVTGSVRPRVPGREVALQRRVDGAWRTVARGPLGADGQVRLSVRPRSAGVKTYRLRLPGTTDLAAGTSAHVRVDVGPA